MFFRVLNEKTSVKVQKMGSAASHPSWGQFLKALKSPHQKNLSSERMNFSHVQETRNLPGAVALASRELRTNGKLLLQTSISPISSNCFEHIGIENMTTFQSTDHLSDRWIYRETEGLLLTEEMLMVLATFWAVERAGSYR